MPSDRPANSLDPTIQALIRRKARQLIGRAGFRADDREDIEQELHLLLLKRLTAFDPIRGPLERFVTRVLGRYGTNLLRRQRAGKRDHRRTRPPATAGPEGLADDARRPQRRSQEELSDLAADVANLLRQLPPTLRDLAARLQSASLAQVARDLRVPRTTLYSRIRRLRQSFEDAGLRAYLHD